MKDAGFEPAQATVAMAPTTTVEVDNPRAGQTLRLLDAIEDLDDIQQVFTNANFTDEALEKYGGE